MLRADQLAEALWARRAR